MPGIVPIELVEDFFVEDAPISVDIDAQMPASWLATTQRSADIPASWRGIVDAARDIPASWAALMSSDAQMPASWLQIASRSADLPASWAALLDRAVEIPVEWTAPTVLDPMSWEMEVDYPQFWFQQWRSADLSPGRGLSGRPGQPSFLAPYFDGTGDYLERASEFTAGNADGTKGIVAWDMQLDDWASGVDQIIYQSENGRVIIKIASDGKFTVLLQNATPTLQVSLTAGTALTGSGRHVGMASWDTTVSNSGRMWIDNIEDLGTDSTVYNSVAVDYTDPGYYVGASASDTLHLGGVFRMLYLNVAEYLDLGLDPNRRKLFRPPHHPCQTVDRGSDGSAVTGTKPLVYLNRNYLSFEVNLAEDDFTWVGAPEAREYEC